jgi:hypothetical protein
MICLEPPGNNTAMRPWREVMPRASPRSSVVFSAKRVSPRRGSSRSKRQITGQRTYTRADITRYSDAYRRGRISEGDYQKISADIVAAGREGRIVGVNPRTHCYACANSQDR